MECQIVGCENEAEYWDTFSGHCGDCREVKVAVCKSCYLEGWSIGDDGEDGILEEAERIDEYPD